MSRESNDAFDAYAKREGYKPGTWNYLRAAKAWNAALAWAAEHDDASGVPGTPEASADTARLNRLEALFASGDVKPWAEFMTRVAQVGFRSAIDGVKGLDHG